MKPSASNPIVSNFFQRNPHYTPDNDLLLDHKQAHRWFSLLRSSTSRDVYTFENILEGKSGPNVRVNKSGYHMMSSYDYLGLIGHPKVERAAINAIKNFGTGSGGVRLLTGTNRLHEQLESAIRDFKGTGSAMVFNSGYMANIAAISALFTKNDRIIIDEFVHRSIIDGLKIIGSIPEKFRHNDMESLKELLEAGSSKSKTVIIVEGIYSMDGDICPLDELIPLKEKYDAVLMVDEAHSIGVLGNTGKGVNEYFGIGADRVDIFTGSLSKAIPANGGFIAARKEVILYLKHGSAPYIFSAALTPSATASAIRSLEILQTENWRLKKLWENTCVMNCGLTAAGFDTGNSNSPVIPVMMPDSETALVVAKKLFDRGFIANAVIYPAVAANRARLRLCCTSAQRPIVMNDFIAALIESMTETSVLSGFFTR
jgi:8-amino-7-oxononanoate synthase